MKSQLWSQHLYLRTKRPCRCRYNRSKSKCPDSGRGAGMRYRKLSTTGDYKFGHGVADFLVDSPACVAQAVLTGLNLYRGDYFLDLTVGMPWKQDVVGKITPPIYDTAIQQYVQGIQGVQSIVTYSSSLDPKTRALTIRMVLATIYGQVQIVAA